MAYENIRLETEDALAILTIDRPKALNALNSKTLQELESALNSLPPTVRALIITGGGDKAFVAGADISEMASITAAQAREFAALGHRAFATLEQLPIPTIAAVNGFALGGGCELALACDLIYASEKAKLGLRERLDAAKAKEVGLVLDVLPADQLLAHCKAVAGKILKNGPLAVSQAKRVIEFGADQDLRAANELERQGFAVLFGSEDQKEGMKAFLEKRPAGFTGK
jgi:enoyl-CoA hydratase